ncbi:hypothetical protein [Streptomyces cyaneofuscatus]|uniref:hypothetical protein n=1 Tax=Streptomyces cyaneofuscatus TaxID=66883 RepID=UPI0037B470F9
MKFLVHCGLAKRVAPKGTYEATDTAQSVARAWQEDPALGKQMLREKWQHLWFVRSARERLSEGPGMRAGLRVKFIRLVKTPGHEPAVDRLLDLMIELGFLIEEPDGYVRWYEFSAASGAEPRTKEEQEPDAEHIAPSADAAHKGATTSGLPAPDERPSSNSGANSPGTEAEDDLPPSQGIPAGENEATVPGPRAASDDRTPASGGDADKLLAQQIGLGDIWYLAPEDAAALHDHLTGLLTVLSTMRTRGTEHGDPLNAELHTPWSLGDIAAMDRTDWTATHRLVRELSTAAPLRRQMPI